MEPPVNLKARSPGPSLGPSVSRDKDGVHRLGRLAIHFSYSLDVLEEFVQPSSCSFFPTANQSRAAGIMCFGSREREDEAGAARSRELDRMIRADEKRMQKEVKLLLLGKNEWRRRRNGAPLQRQTWLPISVCGANVFFHHVGAGESGKSTVLKQMKLIYASGFSKTEKLEWKPVIFNNIVQAFRTIYEAMNELDIKFEKEENEVGYLIFRAPRHRHHSGLS